ncbi:YjgF family protein [Citreicella sp. SE45]|nr:YjgF family protein [Citreicella sp. SE45]
MNLPSSKTRRTDNTLSLSGEIGLGADGTVPAGIEAQTRNIFDRTRRRSSPRA